MGTQQMEIVSSCWRLNNFHVGIQQDFSVVISLTISGNEFILVTKKKESLSSAGWVLWSISIIAMRKKSDKSILDIPLYFSRDDELINNDLSTIGEVTELRLPKSKGIGMGLSIS